ncbi:hypothetical protein [Duganella violaceipulchra]|uniref:Uncharacterized protein n=1 Tax=Duganella violaceipulchra TaxID=2849652 RepID=A0AA41LAK3_9BURK|nr:hypothetical protein [Duganella violaceicalia]MBV6324355.1 hypothetical protein [Duganella violaceicalia]MCP2007252.1 hypothetical protein [Duganella violaceicalia]
MQHPLASLWRHPARVLFYHSAARPEHTAFCLDGSGRPQPMGTRRRFVSAVDAFDYLRYWLGEPGARSELKSILQRSGPSLADAHSGVDGWQHALARRMATGAVVVVEENTRLGAPGRLIAPTTAGATDAAVAALPLLTDATSVMPPPVQEPAATTTTAVSSETPPSVASVLSATDTDQIAQAEALEAAAKDGTPFCEVCEAARKAAQESAEAEANQIAQADTLEQAAVDGTPFCEICEKMRAVQESSNE